MKKQKTHNCLVTFLLSAILLCIVSGFSLNTNSYNKAHKEISASKTGIKTDSFYSEFEEDEESDFETLKSLFVSNTFFKCNIIYNRYVSHVTKENNNPVFENNRKPIYLLNNVFRI